MATTYDDILSRAAEDMLTDIPEVQPVRTLIWVVVGRTVEVYTNRTDAFNAWLYQENATIHGRFPK